MSSQVTFVSLGGDKYTVTYSDNDTVASVKQKLYEECGIMSERQTLYCLGHLVNCDEVLFKDLLDLSGQINIKHPFSVVFPIISWKDGSTDKDLDTDREAFALLLDPFRLILLERDEWISLNITTKHFALLHPTSSLGWPQQKKRRRGYIADFYRVDQKGTLDVMVIEDKEMNERLKKLSTSGNITELRTLCKMRFDEVEFNLTHNTCFAGEEILTEKLFYNQEQVDTRDPKVAFMKAMEKHADFLKKVVGNLELMEKYHRWQETQGSLALLRLMWGLQISSPSSKIKIKSHHSLDHLTMSSVEEMKKRKIHSKSWRINLAQN